MLLRRLPEWADASGSLLLPWAQLRALADAELSAQGVSAELTWLRVGLGLGLGLGLGSSHVLVVQRLP